MAGGDEVPEMGFVERSGCQFTINGEPFYFNGWNSYWLMARSVDEANRINVQDMLKEAAGLGLTVCRTWAFNDAGYEALQLSPGKYDEKVFQALDYAIEQAKQYGIRLLLVFVNNWDDYGGKSQYCKWAREAGVDVDTSTTDSFFSSPSTKDFYKAHIKAIVTRVNSISGIPYSEDPTIFGWELMNEPRCLADKTGDLLQHWIEEMANYVKSLDSKHLLTVGLEGFYGKSSPESLVANPQDWCQYLGCDFVRNHLVPSIDFATIHAYHDAWRSDLDITGLMKQFKRWVRMHAQDTEEKLQMPLVIAEFGLSNRFGVRCQRHMFKSLFDVVYESSILGGAAAGTMIWQLLPEGMDGFKDSYAIVASQEPVISKLLALQSQRLKLAIELHRTNQCLLVEDEVEGKEEEKEESWLFGLKKLSICGAGHNKYSI
ncbi:mannan endo-1,4-beta-mannosidase 8 [Selaginella moellendorffii]|uniref:mannan endo-1,4-beta-mannosidase 8 n=1 Tax=Selaginella moellendorffii TaxID=88036 RepID=UPI000D1CE105|nr:mannan endo-1,4-beta-mannosidase 8 [Selaginella moellendorffii]XP_024534940.1 mannan endo-1,4-beta-mannosidase 8 [Selaginella moellendorffii]XP_024534941.1 mannan endo-1,4-beta-mannosidase 8 [Selaginella moellendorffii]XP_024534942.1 mannan endo-1,4-beta-mannosidase 8 [Selaginella moellendorffii]XP_024534943.1 mannan endo-1,4-beta-mannosidase 8 [Selaginella moellendorffii]|eukprot:XP_024534939.1 mannan endo-1,4-beta-mannosidase 8 [Selaginella moellendorffii]